MSQQVQNLPCDLNSILTSKEKTMKKILSSLTLAFILAASMAAFARSSSQDSMQ